MWVPEAADPAWGRKDSYHIEAMAGFYLWLWYLVPANPIVVRTLHGASRRTRHLWVRMLYLGALIGLVLFGLIAEGGLNTNQSLTDLAKTGTKIFAFVSYAQVGLICLLAPVFLAGAIAQEQAGKTYEILLTTPLSNLQIVIGSLLGRLFFVLALLASGLPLFAVLLVFGGVPVSSVFVAFSVAALVALLVGSVAVLLSVMRAGGRKAVFIFVVAVAGYLIAAYVVDWSLLRSAATKSTTWLTPLHPLLVLESHLNAANYRAPTPESLSDRSALVRFYLSRPFAAFAVISTVISLALLLWSTIFARSIVQSEGTAGWLARWLRLGGALGQERRHPPRPVRGNPVAWREAHTRGNRAGSILARWGFLVAALCAVIIALLVYHFSNKMKADALRDVVTTLLLVEMAVIVMVAIFMSASSASAEREDGTLDLILTTPITPKNYIWGKMRGLVGFLVLMLSAPILTMAVVAGYTVIGWLLQWPQVRITDTVVGAQAQVNHLLLLPEAPLLLAVILIPFVAMCVTLGMSWSLKSKGVLGALVPTVSIVAVASLVLGFCGFNMAENVMLIGPVVNSASPATSVIMLVEPWTHIYGFPAAPTTGRIVLFFSALLAAGFYSLGVYLLLTSMVRGFDQTVRKLSGTG